MRRMIALIIPITLVVAATIVEWDKIVAWSKNSKDVISFMFSVLQLIGIIIIFALAVAVIVQYLYLRPHRFIFEGFSNSAKFAESEKGPLDLNMLAREELVKQFDLMKSDLSDSGNNKCLDREDDLLTGNQDSQSHQESDQKTPPSPFDPQMNRMMKLYLNEVSQSLRPKATQFTDLVKDFSLPEANFMMQLINAAMPPHAIKATGYLQWREEAIGSDQIGITLELEDLSQRRMLHLDTIWWQPSERHPTLTKGIDLAVYYAELLAPAMRWMMVMFFEHQLKLHIPPANHIPISPLQHREKKRLAQLHFMLEVLYYSSAQRHPDYKGFFLQRVSRHFKQAISEVPDWYLPYLYLGNIYSFGMQDFGIEEKEEHEKWFSKAMRLYDEALSRAERAGKKEGYAQYRVRIAMAFSKLASAIVLDCKERAKNAAEELDELVKKRDPADLKRKRANCDVCLYDLALFYITAYKWGTSVDDPCKKGRRYLAYYLARFPGGWDTIDEMNLEEAIVRPLKALQEHDLKSLSGKDLKKEIATILGPESSKIIGAES